MSKLIIHAGFHKTGTSAIQRTLYNNKALLSSNNYFYPNSDPFEAHHKLLARLLNSQIYDLEEAKNDAYRTLATFKEQASGKDIVISSEMICEGLNPIVFERAFELFERVEIHFYIRNQLELTESAYNQQVKQNGESRSLLEYKPYTVDLYSHVEQFRQVFPSIVTKCHLYDKGEFVGGNLIFDFFERVLEIEGPEIDREAQGITNRSLSPVACILLRYANKVLATSSKARQDYIKKLFSSFSDNSDHSYKLIPDHVEEKILQEIDFCNKRLDSEYLNKDYFSKIAVRNIEFLSDEKAFEIARSKEFEVII
ncbi:hypothetical protein [Alteromonas sp. 009811495]|uniref:hypothetical protein n=1 Tax=Alteromonas sp. 009811495 TaxID=3002962 RepID=UPI00237E0087|nr:hypothetical protein [Alteromonas sp. 009811495]WDT85608.1 hypothetical protein OZ660_17010 [Alteromonas sp. 009811495]